VFAPALVFGLYYFLRSDVSLERLHSLAATDASSDEQQNDAPAILAGHAPEEKAALY